MRATHTLLAAALLLSLAAALTAGCGKKAWPEPVKAQDRFYFAESRAALDGGCLTVETDLKGAADNLAEVVLEIGPADCPDCPMRAERVLRFTDRSSFMVDADTLLVRACDLEPGRAVRWRLYGVNALSRTPTQTTNPRITEPAAPGAQ